MSDRILYDCLVSKSYLKRCNLLLHVDQLCKKILTSAILAFVTEFTSTSTPNGFGSLRVQSAFNAIGTL